MLIEMLNDSIRRDPAKTAIVAGRRRISYGDLGLAVESAATGLARMRVGYGDAVALWLPNCPDFIIAFFAAMRLGAVVLPIAAAAGAQEAARLAADAGARAIVVDPPRCAAATALSQSIDAKPVVTSLADLQDALSTSPLPALADAPALYLFTSGSTDKSKRLCFTQANLVAEAANFVDTLGLGADDTIIATVPLTHSYGMGNCLLDAIYQGATLVLLDEGEAPFGSLTNRFFDAVARERVRFFPGVPYQFALLSKLPPQLRGDLSNLRLCVSSTDILPAATSDAFHDLYGVPIRSLYGSTEAGSIAIDTSPRPASGSLGLPLANVGISVRDEAGDPVVAGAEGAIWVTSPAMSVTLSEGKSEFARSVFRDGFYRTGDIGRIAEDGRLMMIGRKQSFVELAGRKVDIAEIEDVLVRLAGIEEAAVLGVEVLGVGMRLKAVVVASEAVTDSMIREHCRRHLPFFKAPGLIERRASLPRSPIGKVMKAELTDVSGYLSAVRSAPARQLLARIASAAPRQRRELMATLVCDQLATILDAPADSLGEETGFVELGVDSFAALELRVRLELLLDRALPETLAFDYPSIAAVAEYLTQDAAPAPAPPGGDILEVLERALMSSED